MARERLTPATHAPKRADEQNERSRNALEGFLGRLLGRCGFRHRPRNAKKGLTVVRAEPAHELGQLHFPGLRRNEAVSAINAVRLSSGGLTEGSGSLRHGRAPYTKPAGVA